MLTQAALAKPKGHTRQKYESRKGSVGKKGPKGSRKGIRGKWRVNLINIHGTHYESVKYEIWIYS